MDKEKLIKRLTKLKEYKPLPEYLAIGPSDIHGAGIFAVEDIPAEVMIGITHVYDTNFEDDYIRTPLGGFINHSNKPNCKLIDEDEYKTMIETVMDSEVKPYGKPNLH